MTDNSDYTKEDWQQEVREGNTVLGYWEWVEHRIEEEAYESISQCRFVKQMNWAEKSAANAALNGLLNIINKSGQNIVSHVDLTVRESGNCKDYVFKLRVEEVNNA